MHAQVIGTHLQPDKHDEAASIYNNVVLPSLKGAAGYAASLLLTDLDTGKAVLVVMWRSRDDLAAHVANGSHQQHLTALGDVLAAPVLTEAYELAGADASRRVPDLGCPGPR